jgi:glycosyltransferase involved in cell wall biosynthesis
MTKRNKKNVLPFVSICTPTFNRRPFIPFMIKCFENQNYPKDKIEWIIIDDGTDPIGDLLVNIPQVKYFYFEEKMLLGRKRNLMHSKCSGDIIIYMDDDDYYPPDRISHAVDMLKKNPDKLIAGSSEMHIFFDSKNKIYQCGPYKENHATAATFAFRKSLLLQTCYNESNAFAEEKEFLKGYTLPMVQLNTVKTILVFSHKHNSLNKEKLLENPEMSKMKESVYIVDDFIKDPELKQFYMIDMNNLLGNYELGELKYKPKLVEQLNKKQEEQSKRIEEYNKMQTSQYISYENSEINSLKTFYEKQLSDKTYLINELLKKIKQLTNELSEYKNNNINNLKL